MARLSSVIRRPERRDPQPSGRSVAPTRYARRVSPGSRMRSPPERRRPRATSAPHRDPSRAANPDGRSARPFRSRASVPPRAGRQSARVPPETASCPGRPGTARTSSRECELYAGEQSVPQHATRGGRKARRTWHNSPYGLFVLKKLEVAPVMRRVSQSFLLRHYREEWDRPMRDERRSSSYRSACERREIIQLGCPIMPGVPSRSNSSCAPAPAATTPPRVKPLP